MQPAHRVAAFLCLCTVFGVSVWLIDAANLSTRANVAAVDESGFIGTGSNTTNQSGSTAKTSTTKDECTVTRNVGGKVTQHGKLCRPEFKDKNLEAGCTPHTGVPAGKCEVIWCTQDDSKCFRASQTAVPTQQELPTTLKGLEELRSRLGGMNIVDGSDRSLVPTTNGPINLGMIFDEETGVMYESAYNSTNDGIQLSQQYLGQREENESETPGDAIAVSFQNNGIVLGFFPSLNASENLSFVPGAEVVSNPGNQSGSINSVGNPQATVRLNDTLGASQSLFAQPQFSNGVFNFDSPNQSPQGAGESGSASGVVTYATEREHVYYNRNFESVGFSSVPSQQQLTPQEIVRQLIANTPEEPTVVTASDLSGGGSVTSGGFGESLVSFGTNLFSPVTEFVSDAFFPEASTNEIGTFEEIETRETEDLFDEERIEFTGVDIHIAAGDPREIFDSIEEIEQRSKERSHNPFFKGALVRTDPWDDTDGALSGYFAFDSGGASSDGGNADNGGDSGDFMSGEIGTRDPIQESFDGTKTPNVFSAMKLTVGTVFQAIGDLFKNIAATLFWWL